MPGYLFRLMALEFRLKALLDPPGGILGGIPLKPGQVVLDFGCGPGRFALVAAELVGPAGLVYALDLHPLAVEAVGRRAQRKGFTQLRTIASDGPTGLPAEFVDVVLLYDTLHDVEDPDAVLAELHRVLKADGVLSFRDREIEALSEGSGFRERRVSRSTRSYQKVP